MKKMLRGSSSGFTLPEMLISIGILGIGMALIGGGIFQALGLERTWSDDAVAVKDLRHAGSWFAGDALNSQQTDLVDGAAPASSATLNWNEQDGVPHSVSYTLVGDRLVRSYDGSPITVARNVVSVEFSRSGKTLRFSLTVQAAEGGIETKSLEIYGRMLD